MNSRACRRLFVFLVLASLSVASSALAGPTGVVNSPFDAHDAHRDGVCLTSVESAH